MTERQVRAIITEHNGKCSENIDTIGEIVCSQPGTGDLHVYFSKEIQVDNLIKELPVQAGGMTKQEFVERWRAVLTSEYGVRAEDADQYGFWISGNLKLTLRVPAHLYELSCIDVRKVD